MYVTYRSYRPLMKSVLALRDMSLLTLINQTKEQNSSLHIKMILIEYKNIQKTLY